MSTCPVMLYWPSALVSRDPTRTVATSRPVHGICVVPKGQNLTPLELSRHLSLQSMPQLDERFRFPLSSSLSVRHGGEHELRLGPPPASAWPPISRPPQQRAASSEPGG